MHEDRRTGATRFNISLVVQGRVPATPISALLLNISLTGCLLETQESSVVSKGATIMLTVSGSITLTGQVAWGRGNSFGVRYHKPIDDDVLATIRRDAGQRDADSVELKDSFGRELPVLSSSPRGR